MKLKLIFGALACMVGSSHAAISITFSSASSGALSNFQNAAGTSVDAANLSNRMVWGILVDSANDGFAGLASDTKYNFGFSLAANNTGIALQQVVSGLATTSNDVLYIASALMASSSTAVNLPATGEVPANQNRILSFSSLTFNTTLGVGAGDRYAIIWFDKLALGGNSTAGMKYGIYVPPNRTVGADSVNVLPTDNNGVYTWSPAFANSVDGNSAKAMNLTLAPEPSSALLGAIGALGLLRRRRN